MVLGDWNGGRMQRFPRARAVEPCGRDETVNCAADDIFDYGAAVRDPAFRSKRRLEGPAEHPH